MRRILNVGHGAPLSVRNPRRSLSYLKGLNPAQSQAVTHDANIPLQILAGPGSGKTRVLTTRIAHLIEHDGYEPSSICAITFAKRAANAVRHQLTMRIGELKTLEIKMGTFHSICARFLRRYGRLIGLGPNFTICDETESKSIIKGLLEPYEVPLAKRGISLTKTSVYRYISNAKARGRTPADCAIKLSESTRTRHGSEPCGGCWEHHIEGTKIDIYSKYEVELRKSNSLDFDDLITYGVRLCECDVASQWCQHVLVDEFQDMSKMQYEFLQHIMKASRRCTIVADPDQSIYGFRAAEAGNLEKMQKEYPSTQQVVLEENYRSTGSIITACLAIIEQDETRITKMQRTIHPQGPLPVLTEFPTDREEAAYIAAEIRRLVAHSGGLLGWGDFAVLRACYVRRNGDARCIANALRLEDVPYRMLARLKLFERAEVRDILAYLQLVDNPCFVPAFTRAINIPGRTLGEKSIARLLARAEHLKMSPLELTERIRDGTIPDIMPPVRGKLASFVDAVQQLRSSANEFKPPSNLIVKLLDLLEYESYLKNTRPKGWKGRWDNVQELIRSAAEFERGDLATRAMDHMPPDVEAGNIEDTPLRLFLQSSMLSTDSIDEEGEDKVTITTCHSAKGLEWPVVMVPAVEKKIYPVSPSADIDEERRILYLAFTRAQVLLYTSHANKRMDDRGKLFNSEMSEFIAIAQRRNPELFTEEVPDMDENNLALLAAVLHRAVPTSADVEHTLREYGRPLMSNIDEGKTSK